MRTMTCICASLLNYLECLAILLDLAPPPGSSESHPFRKRLLLGWVFFFKHSLNMIGKNAFMHQGSAKMICILFAVDCVISVHSIYIESF